VGAIAERSDTQSTETITADLLTALASSRVVSYKGYGDCTEAMPHRLD
jgi:hypothetical protein